MKFVFIKFVYTKKVFMWIDYREEEEYFAYYHVYIFSSTERSHIPPVPSNFCWNFSKLFQISRTNVSSVSR